MIETLTLDGSSLTIDTISRAVRHGSVECSLTPDAVHRVVVAREFLESVIHDRVVYGINTGFGPMSSRVIDGSRLTALQYNLIRSHAVGIGEPIDPQAVLAAMIIRLNTFARGYSGVSLDLVHALRDFIHHRIIPIVPEHGAVGTSGDLVQLAHIALSLIGEGDAWYDGTRQRSAAILQAAGLSPYQLKPKEGLALINGTSMMTGIGALVCDDTRRLLTLVTRAGAWCLELVAAYRDGISASLHHARPQPGQEYIAEQLRTYVAGSSRLRSRDHIETPSRLFGDTRDSEKIGKEVHELEDGIQEIYSLRCIPQVLGPIYDMVTHACETIEREMNASTDNPIVDWEHQAILHGGNFHGDYVALALDTLKIAVTKATLLMERQINFFLNENVNQRHYPPFLNLKTPGLTLALQGLQFVATSTAARSQTLSFPQYVHSISTNADNQDIVSMGTDAALIARTVVSHAYIVLAIELITLAQATDVLGLRPQLTTSSSTLFDEVRKRFPAIIDDRDTTQELNAFVDWLQHTLVA